MTIAPERPASRAPTTEDARLAGMLLSLLPRIGKIAGQVAHERGAMTLERARILWQLVESPRRSGEIAQRCGLTPASVSNSSTLWRAMVSFAAQRIGTTGASSSSKSALAGGARSNAWASS